jgi:ElaB/YqjD/DUF883 family membrane-anchored ribosome-binding protein
MLSNFSLYNRAQSSFTLQRLSSPKETLSLPSLSQERTNFSSFKSEKTDSVKSLKHKSPDDSQYNIKSIFPFRPENSNLSGLTLKENEKFLILTSSILSSSAPQFKSFQGSAPKLPTDQDFEKILNKLELVSSNKNTGHRRLILQDSEPCSILLEKGNTQYFTIRSISRKPPLLITIKKKRGNTVAYLSRITPEPNKSSCDFCFSKESHYVNDVGSKFKNENFFLGVEALTDCEFSVLIGFGKKPAKKKIILKLEDLIDDEDSLFQSSAGDRSKKPQEIKDFIKMNKSSSKYRSTLSSRQGDWQRRREMVVQNKTKNIETKKQRTIFLLHKKEIKRQIERENREQLEKTMLVQSQQRFWLQATFFFKAVDKIREIISTGRQSKFEKIRKSIQVKRIQKLYRNSIGTTKENLSLARGSCLIKLFFYSCKPFIHRQTITAIRDSAKTFVIPKAFMKVVDNINLIKKYWNDYNRRMKTIWERLLKQWNSVLEEQMFKTSRTLTRKRKDNESKKLASIPLSIRNQVLTDYILECKKKYLSEVNDYKDSKKRLLEEVIRHIHLFRSPLRRTSNKQETKSDYPVLTVIPTNQVMCKLIEKGLHLMQ